MTAPATGTTFDLEANGATLGGWVWRPHGEPRAVVVVATGMAEHAGRYAELAGHLTAAGFVVHAADHRGHQRTAGTPDRAGHVADRHGWRVMRDDLAAVVSHVRHLHPGVPVVLLGHSMGSLLARDLVASNPGLVDLLVVSGVIGHPGVVGSAGITVARLEGRLRGPGARSRLLDRLTFGSYNSAFKPTRTRFDWLSRDEAEVDRYIADPWCGFLCSTSFYEGVFTAAQRVNTAAVARRTPKSLPVLVAAGEDDPSGASGKAPVQIGELYRSAGLADVTVTTYPGARHELFHETNRDEVAADLVGWIEQRLTGHTA